MQNFQRFLLGTLRQDRSIFTFVFVAVCFLGFASLDVHAENFIADLSEREIAISSDFSGRKLTLFGSIDPTGESLSGESAEGPLNIVVVVRGPVRPLVVREKSRRFGIWMNAQSVTFSSVPVFFYTASYLKDETPAQRKLNARFQLQPQFLNMQPEASSLSREDIDSFKEAVIRIRKRDKLFVEKPGAIDLKETLFRAEIEIPANVPVGAYNAEIYLIRGDKLIGQSETLYVNKTGLGRTIYEFAMDHSFFYGLFAVIAALLAGWFASVVLRRD